MDFWTPQERHDINDSLLWDYRLPFIPDAANNAISNEEFKKTQEASELAWCHLESAYACHAEFCEGFLENMSEGAYQIILNKLNQWSDQLKPPRSGALNGTGSWTVTGKTSEEVATGVELFMTDSLSAFIKIIR